MQDNKFSILIDNEDLVYDEILDTNKKTIELHDWQRRGIEYFFENGGKAIYNVATGAGKSFFAIEIIKKILEKNPDYKVLIVVPKNVIMESGWHVELYNSGFNVPDIGIFYGNIKEISKITITNMQNVNKLPLELFDVLTADECHCYGTKLALEFIQHDFKYKIGLSATIERTDNKHWDIIKEFNYNVFKYSPKEALDDGILNTFFYYDIGVQLDEATKETYDNLTTQLNTMYQMYGSFNAIMRRNDGIKNAMLSKFSERKQLVNNYKRKFIILREICKKHKNNKMIIFSQFNEQTNKTYWELLECGIKAMIIHSDIKKEEVDKIMINIKKQDTFCILTTKKLDEGWNLPKLDVAVITAGDSSDRQTIQRMGRVLRKKDKESILYQIYCIDTFEEENALHRAKMFKELCNDYKEYTFYEEQDEFVL